MPILLVILFFLTAALYASVGFGGGSTYNALLVLNGVDYRVLPTIALLCNIIVVAGGTFRFARSGHLKFKSLYPFIITSIPLAWLGGRIPVSETLFIGALGFSLLFAGLHLVFSQVSESDQKQKSRPIFISAITGGGIGFLSGLVGIGGGIFLAPVLYFLRWGRPKEIAAACSFFILVNSISGLAGQITKLNDLGIFSMVTPYWPLFPAVLVGGQLGSMLANDRLQSITIKRLTALLILYVSARLILRWLNIVF
ncbi:sulfite exporter TauE/SafE family protein [Hyphococcus formosus]|uniref:sulfite exporter TauE/SafE family protein n=1 Tax=Hyphococcus formosus TaxID=3143534 RepID=UPI00398AE19D